MAMTPISPRAASRRSRGSGVTASPKAMRQSFALLVYASAWLKRHHPGIFACALLNSQPMGFYAPAQIVRDAREHGVVVRPPCINASHWDNVMEPDGQGGLALRLGLRQIKGMAEDEAQWIVAARGNGYTAVEDVWRRAGVRALTLARLAEADCFATLGLSRRDALWAAKALGEGKPLPLFAGDMDGEGIVEPAVVFRAMTTGEQVVEDYVSHAADAAGASDGAAAAVVDAGSGVNGCPDLIAVTDAARGSLNSTKWRGRFAEYQGRRG